MFTLSSRPGEADGLEKMRKARGRISMEPTSAKPLHHTYFALAWEFSSASEEGESAPSSPPRGRRESKVSIAASFWLTEGGVTGEAAEEFGAIAIVADCAGAAAA